MDNYVFTASNSSACRAVATSVVYAALPGGSPEQVRVINAGPSPVSILFGTGAQVPVFPTDSASASYAGMVLNNGATEIFTVPAGASSIAAICGAGGSATIYVSRGMGA